MLWLDVRWEPSRWVTATGMRTRALDRHLDGENGQYMVLGGRGIWIATSALFANPYCQVAEDLTAIL